MKKNLLIYRDKKIKDSNFMWFLFLVLNSLFALVMHFSSLFSTFHALGTLGVGIFISLTTKKLERIGWVAAYICGSEVLWRMTYAGTFWEYGKYAIVALLVIGFLRVRRIKSIGLPLLFFFLLTLSIPLTLFSLSFNDARQAISFNLSGPLTLALSALFFSQLEMDWKCREKTSWFFVAPVVGIASLCLYGIVTSTNIEFTTESNFFTSGGFGPNQVSAVLGLAALLLLLVAVKQRNLFRFWFPMFIAIGLISLSFLTFSRGGVYNFIASLLIFGILSLRNSRLRNTMSIVISLVLFVGGFLIYPKLDEYTGGMLQQRFMDTSMTTRQAIINAEIQVWEQHPILGVGPGMAQKESMDYLKKEVPAHTEYSRILAEHGIFGIIAFLVIIWLVFKQFLQSPKGFPQAWTASLCTWSLMEMTHAAMRIAAIGFFIGIALAFWKPESNILPNENSTHR